MHIKAFKTNSFIHIFLNSIVKHYYIKGCDNMSLFKCAYVRWQLREVYYIDICFYVRYHKSMTYKVPHKHAIQK